jgi:tetratricopeptide (TPR) repeat protein
MKKPRKGRALIVAIVLGGVGCGSTSAPTAPTAPSTPSPDVGNAAPDDTVPATTTRPPLVTEIRDHDERVDLPPVPAFELPAVAPGYRSVHELRARGAKLRGTEVKVHGYVTWIYDCAKAIAQPGMSKRQIRKMIDDDPTLCERPKFYLGDAATTPPEKSIWVVDVPRPPNKLEKKHLPKAELAAWPAVPKIKVGDQVTLVGTFALTSPHSEYNSDGLIVYASLTHDRPGASTEVPAPVPPSTVSAATPAPAPAPARIDRATLEAAEAAFRDWESEYSLGQMDAAATAARRATELWPGHHAAWWGLGMTRAWLGDWASAADAYRRAATLDPGAAMYQLWLGVATYEATRARARADLAARTGKDVSDAMLDLSGVDLDEPLSTLLLAVQQEPRLQRAHYYIGRIHRDHERAREAALAFSAAIAADPYVANPYLALVGLYDRWGYLEEATAVGLAGTTLVVVAKDRSNIWTALGKVYDSAGEPDRALEAYDRAVDSSPDNAGARFQRAQARMRKKDYAGAKTDLEAYLKSGATSDDLTRRTVNKMLFEIAAAQL